MIYNQSPNVNKFAINRIGGYIVYVKVCTILLFIEKFKICLINDILIKSFFSIFTPYIFNFKQLNNY